MDKIYLIYFSPTANTKKILSKIAEGTGIENIQEIDFTLPQNRDGSNLNIDKDALVIFGAPVYMGRLQSTAAAYLKQFKGNGQPAVCIVLYGNRAFEDALIELTDIVSENGFLPIAGAAFIGEHSFTDDKVKIAAGRPDSSDNEAAIELGEKIVAKINANDTTSAKVPGNRPYKNSKTMPKMTPVKKSTCTNCGICKANCPVGAIDDNSVGDKSKCIVCFACIKNCPYGAREMRNPLLLLARKSLVKNPRKEPELYI